MVTRRIAILSFLAAISAILLGWPAFAAPSRAMRQLDTDNDGTIDLEEAKRQLPRCSINSIATTTELSIGAS